MAEENNSEISNKIDVSQLDCHFKWFNELNDEFNGQWLSELLNIQPHNDGTIEDSEYDEDMVETIVLSPCRLANSSWRFAVVLRHTFEKKFTEALEEARALLDVEEANNPDQPQVYIDTYKYLVLSNQMNILEQWRSSSECPVEENVIGEITAKIEPLTNSVNTREGQAFISGMKSNLSKDMGYENLRLHFAKEATNLAPESVEWYKNLYVTLRQLRRSRDFHQPPLREEINAFEEACKREETSLRIAVLKAKLSSDLSLTFGRRDDEHVTLSEDAIECAREALKIKSDSNVLQIRLASLLSDSRLYVATIERKRELKNEAMEIVNSIIKEVVESGKYSSEVCHKIGKVYSGMDQEKALDWFGRALQASNGNFPCLMDMLRIPTLQETYSNNQIIEKIDIVMNSLYKRNYRCQLKFVKGFFIWTYNEEEALDLWLTAMKEDADDEINFEAIAKFNCCYVENKDHYKAFLMMRDVENLLKPHTLTSSEDISYQKLFNVVATVTNYLLQMCLEQHYNSRKR